MSVENEYSKVTRKDFPEGFVFGTATSAYQVEGAAAVGGRGLSVWDDYTMRTPDRITDGSNGNHAVDMYNRFKDDIRMMKTMGFDAYRFSISWPRVIPSGKLCCGVNREAVDYYNDVINTLLANGIQPHVTIFHWDLPNPLEKEYHGFLSENIVNDFKDFADLCFWEFGDRVKHWTTFNEPWSYCYYGYAARTFPPGIKVVYETTGQTTKRSTITRRSGPASNGDIDDHIPLPLFDERMPDRYVPPPTVQVPVTSAMRSLGISGQTFPAEPISTRSQRSTAAPPTMSPEDKEVFIAGKNLILAHAAAMKLYKRKYQDHQDGQIGIALNIRWCEGLTNKKEDQDAARRVHDSMLGWFLEPVLNGRYPETMRKYMPLEARLKKKDRKTLEKYPIDFLGVNYYTARYVKNNPNPDQSAPAIDRYLFAEMLKVKDGKEIGPAPGPDWLCVVPWGIKKLLHRIKELYHDHPNKNKLSKIYITENGVAQNGDPKAPATRFTADTVRVGYYRDHLGNIKDVIDEWKGLNGPNKMELKGYFAWSWIDNFEWSSGYTNRFGLIYIDYMNNLKRYPKLSAIWFSQFLAGKIPNLLKLKVTGNRAMPRSLDGKSNFRSFDPVSVTLDEDTDGNDDDDDDDDEYDDDDGDDDNNQDNKETNGKGDGKGDDNDDDDEDDDDNDDYASDL